MDETERDKPSRYSAYFKPVTRAVGEFWKFCKGQPDRVVELVFSAAIVYFAYQSNKGSVAATQQTDQLISAAKINALAAEQNAVASRNFADSARGINEGISDAVNRLEAQASVSEFARETSELALELVCRPR